MSKFKAGTKQWPSLRTHVYNYINNFYNVTSFESQRKRLALYV